MFWMIVLAVTSASGPAKLMADPVVAFSSQQRCEEAIEVLKVNKPDLPLVCQPFNVIGGVPLEAF